MKDWKRQDFFNSGPFQDYFSSYETGQSVGEQKRENPEKKHLAHPQAELGLSHMWPVRGVRVHTRHSSNMMEGLRNSALNRSATGAATSGIVPQISITHYSS